MKIHLWIIGIIVAIITLALLFGRTDISSIFTLVAVLVCPLMMIFMMKDHHKH